MMEEDYLSVEELIEYQQEETRDIIAELIEDGSDPEALYDIEHHLLAETMEALEPAVVEAFKLGFEVHDAEEVEEDGQIFLCCEAIMQSALNADLIDKQAEQLINLAEKFDIIYDGWGTFYEGDDAIYYEEDEREGEAE